MFFWEGAAISVQGLLGMLTPITDQGQQRPGKPAHYLIKFKVGTLLP
jgi:hypothetical protein